MSEHKKIPFVIVDTDPGKDDACAIYMLLAAEKRNLFKLLAITCVDGNTSVHNGTKNSLRVLQSVDRLDIPVFKGVVEPLIIEPVPKDETKETLVRHHGADGFGGAVFDVEPDLNLIQQQPAVMALIERAKKHKGNVDLICLGLLTNIALATKSDPEFSSNIKNIFIMGGNMTGAGTVTSTAEFNFYHDPEAAHIVLATAKNLITIVPWESCHAVAFSYEWRIEVLGTAPSKQMELLNKIEASALEQRVRPKWTACDQVIAAVYIDPTIAKQTEKLHLTVELHGGRTRGQVVIDHLKECSSNVKLVKEVDQEKLKQLLFMAVEHPECTL